MTLALPAVALNHQHGHGLGGDAAHRRADGRRHDYCPVAFDVRDSRRLSMAFKVKDNAAFDKLAEGKKVEVEFVQEGKGYVITSVK